MSLAALRQGIDWGFESFAAYLALIKSKGMVANGVGLLVDAPHAGALLTPAAAN